MWMNRLVLSASLPLMLLLKPGRVLVCQHSDAWVEEKTTKLAFPRILLFNRFIHAGQDCPSCVIGRTHNEPIPTETLHLKQIALRCMMGACNFEAARAYAVGYYTNSSDKLPLAREDCMKRPEKGEIKQLRLVFSKKIDYHHVGKGLDKSLIKRFRAGAGPQTKPNKEALKQFTSILLKPPRDNNSNRSGGSSSNEDRDDFVFHRNSSATFTWMRAQNPDDDEDELIVNIDDKIARTIKSTKLCRCLFGVYFDDDSPFTRYESMNFATINE